MSPLSYLPNRLPIPVIVLQTIAANLGSMMTPVGNPQNLYLYGISGLGFSEFCTLVAPYTAVTGILLAVCIFFLKGKADSITPAGGCGPVISQKGMNFGGLGTIIASMASLISYKLYAADTNARTGAYMIHFTFMQIVFLIGLLAAYLILSL